MYIFRIFRHGDLLYLAEKPNDAVSGSAAVAVEDEVDQLLAQKDARIERSRDPQLYVMDGQNQCRVIAFHTLQLPSWRPGSMYQLCTIGGELGGSGVA